MHSVDEIIQQSFTVLKRQTKQSAQIHCSKPVSTKFELFFKHYKPNSSYSNLFPQTSPNTQLQKHIALHSGSLSKQYLTSLLNTSTTYYYDY